LHSEPTNLFFLIPNLLWSKLILLRCIILPLPIFTVISLLRCIWPNYPSDGWSVWQKRRLNIDGVKRPIAHSITISNLCVFVHSLIVIKRFTFSNFWGLGCYASVIKRKLAIEKDPTPTHSKGQFHQTLFSSLMHKFSSFIHGFIY